jgi:hypothetical protein
MKYLGFVFVKKGDGVQIWKNGFFGHNKEKSLKNPLEQNQGNLCLP